MTEYEYFIGNDFIRISKDKLEEIKQYGACVVSDALKGFNAMDGRIRTMVPGKKICGCAVTVRLRPGDNLFLHEAIEQVREGDIIVIDTGSDYRHAVIGGIMSGAAFAKKHIAGLIVDGAVRDVEELRKNGYPVFAAAIVPNTGDHEGPGMLNQPVSCGGVPVMPGDIIVADDNGVAVIPQHSVSFVLENCKKKIIKEKKRIDEIEKGQITSSLLLKKLHAQGF
ncbi:MAG: RraA family protein [Megasphaera sp.]|jgi:regulator of RNase E activity RraA|nr:RraA family protein [Megasphaera sp.]MCI1247482.1 RraA family protein [Megasphaera sp.]